MDRQQEQNIYALARIMIILTIGTILFFGTLENISFARSGGDYIQEERVFTSEQIRMELRTTEGFLPTIWVGFIGFALMVLGGLYTFYFILRLILCDTKYEKPKPEQDRTKTRPSAQMNNQR